MKLNLFRIESAIKVNLNELIELELYFKEPDFSELINEYSLVIVLCNKVSYLQLLIIEVPVSKKTSFK